MTLHIVKPTDDWCGVYINGNLIFENHSVDGVEMAKIIEENSDGTPIEVHRWSYDDPKALVDDRIEDNGDVWYNGVAILSGWKCPAQLRV